MTIQEAENSLDQALSRRAPPDPFFRPHRVAVIGASEEQGSVGLAVIATPAATVPSVIADCGQAVVISAGFKETGSPGAARFRRGK
jgi:acyl-CoA synthetase (NDP forming)